MYTCDTFNDPNFPAIKKITFFLAFLTPLDILILFSFFLPLRLIPLVLTL